MGGISSLIGGGNGISNSGANTQDLENQAQQGVQTEQAQNAISEQVQEQESEDKTAATLIQGAIQSVVA
jgi:hypothetical protein